MLVKELIKKQEGKFNSLEIIRPDGDAYFAMAVPYERSDAFQENKDLKIFSYSFVPFASGNGYRLSIKTERV